LLKEVHGFSLEEIADLLGATQGQAKNWLQEARAYMTERYQQTCALIAKNGVCYQCVELDGYFQAKRGNPLEQGNIDLQARLEVLASLREKPWGRWHQMLFAVIDDLK
jgi:RNA polymerase sigma-70 factor (ECF subfamily)